MTTVTTKTETTTKTTEPGIPQPAGEVGRLVKEVRAAYENSHEELAAGLHVFNVAGSEMQTDGNLMWREVFNDGHVQELVMHRGNMTDEFSKIHVHPDSMELFIVVRGSLEIEVEGKSLITVPPCMCIVEAGKEHRGRAVSPEFYGFALCIPPEVAYAYTKSTK